MHLIPIFGREREQIEERLRLFRALGCEIYQDTNGQLFAVILKRPKWLNIPNLLVYESDQVPAHWVLVTEDSPDIWRSI